MTSPAKPQPLFQRRSLLAWPLLALPWARAQALEVGAAAPALELEGPSGRVDLAALRGRVVYLDFWASWCAPCRQSFPWMDRMVAQHGPAGLSVVAVNVDRQRSDADQFLRALPTRATIAFDGEGATPLRFGVRAMPTSFIIGRDGRVRLHHRGFKEADTAELEAALRQALTR